MISLRINVSMNRRDEDEGWKISCIMDFIPVFFPCERTCQGMFISCTCIIAPKHHGTAGLQKHVEILSCDKAICGG